MDKTRLMVKNKFEDNIIVSKEDVINFLQEADLKGYQSIDLPFGLRTPGMDRSKSADIVFKDSVKNKSVLDIGCKYGYFCHDAILRGASVVKGIEISETNVEIAKRIVELWNRDIEIISGDFLGTDFNDKFDVVLLLNVLHHIISPVTIMKKISNQTNELAIIEFPTILDSHTGLSSIKKIIYKLFFKSIPLIYLGNRKYHRLWYFSKPAFNNLVVDQLSLFRRIKFVDSPRKSGRIMAHCWK